MFHNKEDIQKEDIQTRSESRCDVRNRRGHSRPHHRANCEMRNAGLSQGADILAPFCDSKCEMGADVFKNSRFWPSPGLGTIRNDALRDTEISVRLSQRKHDNIRSHFGSSSCLLCIAIVVALAYPRKMALLQSMPAICLCVVGDSSHGIPTIVCRRVFLNLNCYASVPYGSRRPSSEWL